MNYFSRVPKLLFLTISGIVITELPQSSAATGYSMEGTLEMSVFNQEGREVFKQSGPFVMAFKDKTLSIRVSPVRSITLEDGASTKTISNWESAEYFSDGVGSISVIRHLNTQPSDASPLDVVGWNEDGEPVVTKGDESQNNQANTTTLNQAEAVISPTLLPAATHSMMLPLWLANGTYLPESSPSAVEVLYDDYRGSRSEPVMKNAVWTRDARTPAMIDTFHSFSSNDSNLTNFVYQVTEWQGSDEMRFPVSFEATRYSLSERDVGQHIWLAATTKGIITRLDVSANEPVEPNLHGTVWVTDDRFTRGETEPVSGVGYLVDEGRIPAKEKVRDSDFYQKRLKGTSGKGSFL